MNQPNTGNNTGKDTGEKKLNKETLEIYPRTSSGKNAAYKTRRSKFIPAVVYGPRIGQKTEKVTTRTGISICLEPRNFVSVYQNKGRTTLVDLSLQDGAPSELAGSKVLIKDLQKHTLKNEVMHVDILQLDLTQSLRVSVPLKFIGKAIGLVEGGILSIISRQAEIRCLPEDIPHEIEVDVTDLKVNDSLHIQELSEKTKAAGNKKYEFIYDSDYTLCAVVPPEEEKVVAPVADAAAAAGAPGAPAAAGAAPAAGDKAGAAPAAGDKAGAAPAAGADKAKGKDKK